MWDFEGRVMEPFKPVSWYVRRLVRVKAHPHGHPCPLVHTIQVLLLKLLVLPPKPPSLPVRPYANTQMVSLPLIFFVSPVCGLWGLRLLGARLTVSFSPSVPIHGPRQMIQDTIQRPKINSQTLHLPLP